MNYKKQLLKSIGGTLPLEPFKRLIEYKTDDDAMAGEVVQYASFSEMRERIKALPEVNFEKFENLETNRNFDVELMCIMLRSHDIARKMKAADAVELSQILRAKGCPRFHEVNKEYLNCASRSNQFYSMPLDFIFPKLVTPQNCEIERADKHFNSGEVLRDYLEEDGPFNGVGDGSIIGDWVQSFLKLAKECEAEKQKSKE